MNTFSPNDEVRVKSLYVDLPDMKGIYRGPCGSLESIVYIPSTGAQVGFANSRLSPWKGFTLYRNGVEVGTYSTENRAIVELNAQQDGLESKGYMAESADQVSTLWINPDKGAIYLTVKEVTN